MTEEIFREDGYARSCEATVVSAGPDGIVLDRTVFYPEGGGQPGDTGTLRLADGRELAIVDTQKGDAGVRHLPAEDAALPAPGDSVTATIDWERRYRFMRMHTCLHLLLACVDAHVTGGQVGEGKGRVDFNLPDTNIDKAALEARLNQLVAEDHPVGPEWITDEEMAARPELVRTMSVKPPTGAGRVRLVRIGDGVDLQPCGGTHVASTGEIGPITIGKIENKGRQNRRINLRFAD
jgi:misacylated tRNA(Ala) deacylase